MMPIRSRIQALAATAAVLALVPVVPARTQTLPPNTIIIERWPQDVPCRVLKRYPDGTWEITVPYTLYQILHRGAKFGGEAIAAYFEHKCWWRAK